MLETQAIAQASPRISVPSAGAKDPMHVVLGKTLCRAEPREPVAAVIVSRDRPAELGKTLQAVAGQNFAGTLRVIVVDSSAEPATVAQVTQTFQNVSLIHSAVNLGGAGGFALGLLSAVATGATWVWLMDDDGRPVDQDVLATLLATARRKDLAAISPVIIDPEDPALFAFPYPVHNRYVFRRRELAQDAFLASTAHLFNGLLIRATAVFACGLPDVRLFIRGDEIDFMYRMRRAGLRFGTTATATFSHPSSNSELHALCGGLLHVVYPQSSWKRRCQYRNRAYNFSRHGRWLIMAIDAVRYPYFFLFRRRGDFASLREWLACSWSGMRGKLGAEVSTELASLPENDASL